jgi:hypothetical protein
MALWHPQQSFFVGGSLFVGRLCYLASIERRWATAIALGLAAGGVAYLCYRSALPFHYAGRAEFMALHGDETLRRNLFGAPVAFAPILVFLLVLAPSPRRLVVLLVAWLCVLAAVATMTTDVTRVMTITSLPIVLFGAQALFDGGRLPSRARMLVVGILIALIPPLNWSGFDYLLWPDLIDDLCKWHLHCFRAR